MKKILLLIPLLFLTACTFDDTQEVIDMRTFGFKEYNLNCGFEKYEKIKGAIPTNKGGELLTNKGNVYKFETDFNGKKPTLKKYDKKNCEKLNDNIKLKDIIINPINEYGYLDSKGKFYISNEKKYTKQKDEPYHKFDKKDNSWHYCYKSDGKYTCNEEVNYSKEIIKDYKKNLIKGNKEFEYIATNKKKLIGIDIIKDSESNIYSITKKTILKFENILPKNERIKKIMNGTNEDIIIKTNKAYYKLTKEKNYNLEKINAASERLNKDLLIINDKFILEDEKTIWMKL